MVEKLVEEYNKQELDLDVLKELERQLLHIKRGVVEIVPEVELEQKLLKSIITKTPLKVKLGIDPTAPDIHLGHTVVLQKLKTFQELGHQVQLVIGDFTGRIGDPTGRSEARKQLTTEQVTYNAETYLQQVEKIIDKEKINLSFNSSWLAPLNFEEIIRLAGQITVARMLEREDFHKRYSSQLPISVHEFFYPLMQGYDSVALESDIELGGTDQKFNLLMGRTLQKEFGQQPQIAIMTPLLEGLDGVKKMSKSLGNYIGIDEDPKDIYGKAMSIADELMLKYFELVTDVSIDELAELKQGLDNGNIHPRDAKMKLAFNLVEKYYNTQTAIEAQDHFKSVFQNNQLPSDIEVKELSAERLDGEGRVWIAKLIHELGLVGSSGEGKRMVTQGAVKINEEKIDDVNMMVTPKSDMIIQVGKRKFAKIK
jgi:tyrosyl-tRNA synthetase